MVQKTLDELVDLRTEKTGGSKDPCRPYVGLEHLAQGSPRLVGYSPSDASISTNCLFETNDILFGKLRPNLRKSIRAPFPGYCSTDILVLRARDGIDPGFAAQVFQWETVFNAAIATAAGTKMPRTSWNDLKRFRVPCPSDLEGQARIAALLDTVDTTIAKTEAVIAKLKQVRAGVVHDLLTRGLDYSGELRNPNDLVQSSIGLIPKEWGIRPLRECLLGDPQNGIYKPARLIGRGVLLVGQTSIDEERRINISLARRAAVSAPEVKRFALAEGDVLISRVFATLAGVGMPALTPLLPGPAVYESNMMRLQVDRQVILPQLLFEALRGCRVRARVIAAAHLSNQASINQVGLNSIPILVPTPDEQCAIAHQMILQDHLIDAAMNELRKLARLRIGLITELLCGRVDAPEGIRGNDT